MATQALRDLSIALAPKTGTTTSTPGSDPTGTMTTPDSSTGVPSGVRSLTPDTSMNGVVNDNLSSYLKSSGNLDSNTKTIMETFAARAGLTKEKGLAERSLTDSQYGTKIADQLNTNASEYTNASEGRSGFATQTAAVRMLEDSGTKRIRDLEKSRDELLLQSKIGEASRLDGLINDEQTAITNARKTWIDNLLMTTNEQRAQNADARSASQENRAIAGFETPEQARQRDLVSNLAGDSIKQIQTLATTAPSAGILSTDTFDQAVQKYRNSTEYKQNVKKGELEIEQAQANIANTRSLTTTRVNGGSGAGGGSTPYGSDLDALIGSASQIAAQGGKFNLANFNENLKRARNDGDKINTIATAVLANAPATVKNDFNLQANSVNAVDQAIAMLDQGVQTGKLNSATQYTYNLVGKDYDPKLAQLNQLITSAIQPYRSSITGAAWGPQEDAEYQSLFGSLKYSPAELRTRLEGIKQIMLRKTSTGLNQAINPLGTYGNVFNPAGMTPQNGPIAPGYTPNPTTSGNSKFDFSGS